jgi:hypothetical protein
MMVEVTWMTERCSPAIVYGLPYRQAEASLPPNCRCSRSGGVGQGRRQPANTASEPLTDAGAEAIRISFSFLVLRQTANLLASQAVAKAYPVAGIAFLT